MTTDFPRCKTCKWFAPSVDHPDDEGMCDKTLFDSPGDDGSGPAYLHAYARHPDTKALAVVILPDDYTMDTRGLLYVAADFGCVMHEVKP